MCNSSSALVLLMVHVLLHKVRAKLMIIYCSSGPDNECQKVSHEGHVGSKLWLFHVSLFCALLTGLKREGLSLVVRSVISDQTTPT